MTTSASPATLTLRDTLLRSRLIHRQARLQLVLTALRDRVDELDRHDAQVPEPLLAAITDFEAELAAVSEGLRESIADPSSIQRTRQAISTPSPTPRTVSAVADSPGGESGEREGDPQWPSPDPSDGANVIPIRRDDDRVRASR